MESQTVQPTVIDVQTLQQLEDDIKNELNNILKNSNFGELLGKYGLSGQNILKVQCLLDLAQIEVSDANHDQQVDKSLSTIIQQSNTTLRTVTISGFYNPCPVPGYPGGCWVA
ncbi:hypothetical protein GTQ43_27285 [Nostoc sp. KVJ3]|uniref:hypothetical protein n=1 Tax=Nostoc sp. KVJ3 TaxID=457945 RepID=UPI002237C1C8|nr:hypothetical protein [Nostoc sp. KVJ3]MCW5317375.1 hypothetical protein [Nostoc sp. KVJ3]